METSPNDGRSSQRIQLDFSKRHSTAWQEQSQRRLSLTKATIRAVTPDFSPRDAAVKDPFLEGVLDPSALSSNDRIALSKDARVNSAGDERPRTALDGGDPSEKGARRFFIRSRTLTLDDPPRNPRFRPFPFRNRQRMNSDTAITTTHAHGSNFASNLSRIPREAANLPSPSFSTTEGTSYAAREVRKLQRNRHRRVKSPVNGHSSSDDGAIIKVGKLMYWDNSTPLDSVDARPKQSTLTRRAKVWRTSWRGVSAVIRENGELKLFDQNDVRLIATIQLSLLSRCAVQQLHASVLKEDFCIAIYPQQAVSPVALSPARPTYLSLDSRILFEAWFVLLRAFTIPEIYGSDQVLHVQSLDVAEDPETSSSSIKDIFRLERSVSLRVIEARLRSPRPRTTQEESAMTQLGQTQRNDLTPGNYFVEVVIDGVARARTMPRTDTSNLFWREDFEFIEMPRALSSSTIILKREDIESSENKTDLVSSKEGLLTGSRVVTCGKVDIEFDGARHDDQETESLYPIEDEEQEIIGEMLLKIRAEELVVLMLREYHILSELLHNFSSGLTLRIARMLPRRLQRLSETLVNIFQVSGRISTWVTTIAKDEIEGKYENPTASNERSVSRAGSNGGVDGPNERYQSVAHELGKSVAAQVNILFRGNTLLTRSLDIHMRRIGKEYLEEILGSVIGEIDRNDVDCEVDPSRIMTDGDLKTNWSNFVKYFRMVWRAIYESTARCPREMRLLLGYIRESCEERFGEHHHTVRYSSVSGFLFLRFFCPAVLNPKLFGLLSDHPRPKAQRSLTLIAKSLQGLANMSTFGAKEPWMEPMNKHLVIHRQEFREFIDSICSISRDQYQQTTPPSYATPMTILSRLPPTHREGFPSLPYLIDEARNYAILVNLWLDYSPDTKTIEMIGGDLLKFHEQCVHLRRRTSECVAKVEEQQQRRRKHTKTKSSSTLPSPTTPIPETPSTSAITHRTSDQADSLPSPTTTFTPSTPADPNSTTNTARTSKETTNITTEPGSPRSNRELKIGHDDVGVLSRPSSSSKEASSRSTNKFSDLVTLGFRRKGR
ncbi:MAG: hypothetical protein M1816_006368 [Peltula sp. TS41687]|nr:MAG: hypothetical protein M1816_006368 [Peltula sp. TS41687]